MLAGAGGLDGGVQREQVGLVGDAGNRLHDFSDGGGLRFQFRHHLHGAFLAFRGLANGENGVRDLAGDFVDLALQGLRLAGRGCGVLPGFLDEASAEIDRLQRLLRRARGFLGAGADLFDRLAQLLGRGCGFRDAARELTCGRRYPFGRLLLAGVCLSFSFLSFGQQLAAAYRNFVLLVGDLEGHRRMDRR